MTPDLSRTIDRALAIGERRRRMLRKLLAAIDREDWEAVVACSRELRGEAGEAEESVQNGRP